MNLFQIPAIMKEGELFQALVPDRGILIERIISAGQFTPPGEWLIQDRDEWVALLQGAAHLAFEDGVICDLRPGDWLLIEAGRPHRVEYTSAAPPCIWLAVHGPIINES